MTQPGLTFDWDDAKFQKRLKKLLKQAGDLTPAMEIIGEIGVSSIQKNFEQGGRPDKWPELADATKAQRIKMNKWPGELLVNSGDLKRISYQASGKKVVMTPANVPYAAIHQFGGQAGRGRKVKIPAREYLLFQDEDVVEAKAVVMDHILDQ